MFEQGDAALGVFSAGMVIGLIHDVPTVKVLVERIVRGAEEIIASRFAGMMDTRAA